MNIPNAINKIYTNHPILFLLAANAVFIASAISILPFYFEDNDDVTMIGIISGAMFGTPDYHSVFINSLLGFVSSRLYLLSNSIEWYTLLFVILHIISCTIISNFILNHFLGRVLKLAGGVFLYSVEIILLTHFQFTTTACLSATAALFLIIDNRKGIRIQGILLFILASFIRFHAAMLTGLVFVCAYPYYIYKTGFDKRIFFSLCFCLCVAFTGRFADVQVYRQDSDWSYYYDYNSVRGQLNDSSNEWRYYSALPESVDTASYELFRWYFFQDPEVLDLSALKQIQSNIEKQYKYKGIPHIKKNKNVLEQVKNYYWEMLVCLLISCVIFIKLSSSREALLLIPLSLCLPLVLSYIALDSYVKYRVFLCTIIPLILIHIFIFCITTKKRQGLSYVLGVLVLILSCHLATPSLRSACGGGSSSNSQVIDPKGIYIYDASCFRISPWKIRTMQFSEYGTGWASAMPHLKSITYKNLIDNNDTPLIIKSFRYNEFCTLITHSIKNQYQKKVKPIIINEDGDKTMFYLVSESNEDSNP